MAAGSSTGSSMTAVEGVWIGANGLIMRDPLYFATSPYSNLSQARALGASTGHEHQARGN